MKAAVTQWFPPDQPPVHAGAYELENLVFPFHYWDGKGWLQIAESKPEDITPALIGRAGPANSLITYIKRRPWRGLASDPSNGAA